MKTILYSLYSDDLLTPKITSNHKKSDAFVLNAGKWSLVGIFISGDLLDTLRHFIIGMLIDQNLYIELLML